MLRTVCLERHPRPVAVSDVRKQPNDWSKERMSDTRYMKTMPRQNIEVLGIDKYEADMYLRAFAKKNEEK